MGSYCSLIVGNNELFVCKNSVPEIIYSIFDYDINHYIKDEQIDEETIQTNEGFSCTVEEAYKRLRIKHHITYFDIEQHFKNKIIENYEVQEIVEEYLDGATENEIENFIMQEFTFDRWINTHNDILNNSIGNKGTYKRTVKEVKIDELFYCLYRKYEEDDYQTIPYYFGGFVELKEKDIIALVLKASKNGTIVECSISDVVENGWISQKEIKKKFKQSPKASILTEGTTDMSFIKDAMNIIYPQFLSSFHFTDLSEVKTGCVDLKSYLQILSATETNGNYIGIFDNDVAAAPQYKEAYTKVKKTGKTNIKIIKLPEDKDFEDYPYRGVDNNIHHTNINGCAVSIELFYPNGVIKKDGDFEPILWSNYDKNTKKYQGHIEHKTEVQNKWEDYKKYKSRYYDKDDFRRAKKLLDSIINEFND